MNVWLVKPDGFTHAEGQRHVAQAFADSFGTTLTVGTDPPRGKTLVFCGHLLKEIGRDMTIYNSEPISEQWFSLNQWIPNYKRLLINAQEVWDYSPNNIAALMAIGINARLVEVGYMPSMTKERVLVRPDIDVLFFGSLNDRRKSILDSLALKCNLKVVYNIYGEPLDELIFRSKIILNMHYYEAAIFEIFRCSYLMANRRCIVSETGNDKALERQFYDCISFSNYNDLLDNCVQPLGASESYWEPGRGRIQVVFVSNPGRYS